MNGAGEGKRFVANSLVLHISFKSLLNSWLWHNIVRLIQKVRSKNRNFSTHKIGTNQCATKVSNHLLLCWSGNRTSTSWRLRDMTVATHNKYVIAMHVFCNWLVRVHEQRIVAQAAMRHSRIELTTNFYTDPALLDVNGAVNALPDFMGKHV